MPKHRPVTPRNTEEELSSDDLDKVTGGSPALAPPMPYPNVATTLVLPAPAVDELLREGGFD